MHIKNNYKRGFPRNFTKDEIDKIVYLYKNERKTTRDIGKIFNCTHGLILKTLRVNSITPRDALNSRIKAGYNREFFRDIDTEEKAYFLGLLYADGCNHGKSFSISLQERDGYLIRKLQKAMRAHKIKIQIKIARDKKWSNQICLSIGSINMCNDLSKLGCHPRKSLSLSFPTSQQVPDHLIHHFIRGYFDGDGGICLTKVKAKGKYKTDRIEGAIGITSSTCFCGYLKDFFIKIGIRFSIVKRFKHINCSTLQSGGAYNIFKFYQYIYNDANIWMTRKRIKFEEFFKMKNFDINGTKTKRGRGKSKYRGVYLMKTIWNGKEYSYIRVIVKKDKKSLRLGTFKDEISAAKAYDAKAFEVFGLNAILNFPDDYKEEIENLKIKNNYGISH